MTTPTDEQTRVPTSIIARALDQLDDRARRLRSLPDDDDERSKINLLTVVSAGLHEALDQPTKGREITDIVMSISTDFPTGAPANGVVRSEPPMTYVVVKDGVMHTQPVPCWQVPSIGESIDYCGPCKVWDVCWSEGCAVLSASTPPGFGPDGDDA